MSWLGLQENLGKKVEKDQRFFVFKREAVGCGGQNTDQVPGQL